MTEQLSMRKRRWILVFLGRSQAAKEA